MCDWRIYKEGTIGSDHYPILCRVNISMAQNIEVGEGFGFGYLKRLNGRRFRKIVINI